MMKTEYLIGRRMIDFQAESKKSGDKFEDLVHKDLISREYINLKKNFDIPEIGIQVDFFGDYGHYIEAKGGAEGDKKRPGAKRTDNVKKAIANGALLKKVNGNAYYIVYFSSRPIENSSSDKMLKAALKYNFIDEIRYLQLEDDDLEYTLFDEWNYQND